MSFEKDFLDLMPHTVKIYRAGPPNFNDEPTYPDPPKVYRARIVGKGLVLRDRQGQQDTVVFDVYIDMGDDVVTQEDKIELPADLAWMDSTPEIFSVGRYDDEEGHHHTKIQCGWMYHRQGQ